MSDSRANNFTTNHNTKNHGAAKAAPTGHDDPAKAAPAGNSDNKQVEIYKLESGEIVFDLDADAGTLWATQAQISQLFDVDRSVITRHLRNIYQDGELEPATTAKTNEETRAEGNRLVKRKVQRYNLDAIISVGYRVNSTKPTQFRIWATKTLKSYIVDGVAVNETRLKQLSAAKLEQLESTFSVVRRLLAENALSADEATGILEILSHYNSSFATIGEFGSGRIQYQQRQHPAKALSLAKCLEIVNKFARSMGDSTEFGALGDPASLEKELVYINSDALPGVAAKAAELLYYLIKERPFQDGNKRIAAFLFIVYLTMNDFQLSGNGEVKISDRALVALTLLIAESDPAEKNLIVALICKLLEE